MKRNCFYLILLFTVLVSCKKHKGDEKFNDSVPKTHQELYGDWVGSFVANEYKEGKNFSFINKINLKITGINTYNQVEGISIVAGNKRPLVGTFDEGTKKFELKESGKNKYDGMFEFTLINQDSINGFWKAFDTTITVTKRVFGLSRKVFVYSKNLMLPELEDGVYMDYTKGIEKQVMGEDSTISPETYYRRASDAILRINASTTELMEDSLKNLKKLDLQIIKNTIYARHGYTFSSRRIRQFFDNVDWYIPVSDNVEKQLTPLEIKNIALLKRFEKYAEDKYDTFGR